MMELVSGRCSHQHHKVRNGFTIGVVGNVTNHQGSYWRYIRRNLGMIGCLKRWRWSKGQIQKKKMFNRDRLERTKTEKTTTIGNGGDLQSLGMIDAGRGLEKPTVRPGRGGGGRGGGGWWEWRGGGGAEGRNELTMRN